MIWDNNIRQAIDQTALQAYLAKEMKAYRKQLKEMMKENENAKSDGKVTQAELMKIKNWATCLRRITWYLPV